MTTRPFHRRVLSHGRATRRGYVLLLTLMILALAATVLAGVCRSSLARALEARAAAEELQRRWGVISCRTTLLPEAGRLLAEAEAVDGRSIAKVEARVELGGQTFDLTFADEQAKANVNALVRSRGRSGAEAAIRRLLRASGHEQRPKLLAGASRRSVRQAQLDIDDREATPDDQNDDDDDAVIRPIQSLGQIFPGVPPERLGGAAGHAALTNSITCWGDGGLHLRRASEPALREISAGLLSGADLSRVSEARADDPDADPLDILEELGLSDERLAKLEDRLAADSLCHSLWIVSSSGRRSWYHLAVDDQTAGDEGPVLTYDW